MTRLFGKKNKQTTIAELEEYYANQNQKRNKPWKAWLMAFLSLLITIAIVIGLFFGGRWLYRTFVDDSNGDSTTTADNNSGRVDLPSFDGGFDNRDTNGTTTGETSEDSDQSDGGNGSGDDDPSSNEGVVSDEAASTDESNEDRLTNAGAAEDELPNTGPGESMAVLLFSTAIFGYLIAKKKYLR